ncbi:glycosyltransferase [Pseudomonadota bacterium]
MIFLTVGTYPLQFDRLIQAVDNAVRDSIIDEEIFAQIGFCRYKPKYIKYAEMLEKSEFDTRFKSANYVIGHAGMGTISMALEEGKPALVMARMAKFKEHVNDHQVSTADMFERMGHMLVAHTVEELPQKLRELRSFVPLKREATPRLVAERIGEFLTGLLR